MDEPQTSRDEHGMRLALDQALNARLVGEVPVGAVVTEVPVPVALIVPALLSPQAIGARQSASERGTDRMARL